MFENEMSQEEYRELVSKKGKYRKYRSSLQEVDGIRFDSAKEAQRWQELKMLVKTGEIKNLKRQVKYQLLPNQRDNDGTVIERAVTYIADFVYIGSDGRIVCEDTKGYRTKEYIIKRKLMLYIQGIRIKEV